MTWRLAITVLVVLVVALVFVGPGGPISWLIPTGTVLAAIGLALFTVRQARRDRELYEAMLQRQAATRAVAQERLALARQLHDIASHGLGLITVRAATVRHANANADHESEAIQALGDIETAARSATAELRRMLSVLRDGEPTEPLPRSPVPGLNDIAELLATATDHGLTVTVTGDDEGGHAQSLKASAGAQLLVHQVLQEALLNSARHCGPTDVVVLIDRAGDDIVVEVTDTGPTPGWVPTSGSGRGLAGLSERLKAVDGSLDAGPDGGGHRVRATIPDPVMTVEDSTP